MFLKESFIFLIYKQIVRLFIKRYLFAVFSISMFISNVMQYSARAEMNVLVPYRSMDRLTQPFPLWEPKGSESVSLLKIQGPQYKITRREDD